MIRPQTFPLATQYRLLVYFCTLVLLISCGEPLPSDEEPGDKTLPSTFVQAAYDSANASNGGKLYDKWFTGGNTPKETQPMWKTLLPTESASNGKSWQCVSCHNWHYRENKIIDGSPGIGFTKKTTAEIFDFIKNGKIPFIDEESLPHQFGGDDKLSDPQIYDLTKFIKDEASEQPLNTRKGTNQQEGQAIFAKQSCEATGCHANNLEAKTSLSQTSPYRFSHVMRFGKPNTSMKGGLSEREAREIKGFLLAKPNIADDFDSNKYNTADPIRGGKLYDTWWIVSNTLPDTIQNDHPLWKNRAKQPGFLDNNYINPRQGIDTWRCTECHGWDYMGANGAYGQDPSHRTSFMGIHNAVATKTTSQAIYDFLQNDTEHGYGAGSGTRLLSDDNLYDLTKFIIEMRKEALTGNKITLNKQAIIDNLADIAAGKTLYEETILGCATAFCHGADGKTADFFSDTPDTIQQYIHDVAIHTPWRFVHKIRYGQPGQSAMPAMADDTFSYQGGDAIKLLAYAQTLNPDAKRGGRLFDNWIAERQTDHPDFTGPPVEQPNWKNRPEQTPGSGDYYYDTPTNVADTWRCKDCHGWDYQGPDGIYGPSGNHNTGMRNLLEPTAAYAATPDGITFAKDQIIGAINQNHSFFSYAGTLTAEGQFFDGLSLRDLHDLAQFLVDEIGAPKDAAGFLINGNDIRPFINTGDITSGETLYNNTPGNCIVCHAETGIGIPNVDLGILAVQQPERFLHKVRFGFPNSIMIPRNNSFTGLSLPEAADVLAYSKTLTTTVGDANYEDANIVRGGRLFDQWWTEKGAIAPDIDNPHWQYRDDSGVNFNPNTGAETWRCITCHGWDYEGRDGINSRPNRQYTGFQGINGLRLAAGEIPDESSLISLFNYLAEGFSFPDPGTQQLIKVHNFSQYLDERDRWDLVKFIKEGQINTYEYLRRGGFQAGVPIYTPNGNAFIGKILYETPPDSTPPGGNCASATCHRPAGDGFNFGSVAEPKYLGHIVRENPWLFMHKARFGQPGSAMNSTIDSKLSTQDMVDIMTYTQTLNPVN